MNKLIRGIRGAITINENKSDEIINATKKLLIQMTEKNNVTATNISHIIISVTDDINADFPAKALRQFDDWMYVPVMCTTEISVPHSLRMCIRILMTVNTDTPQEKISHIYLEGATKLRPDLINEQ
jgi:chorismate mutase